jgi:hypothetical protein
MISNEHTLSSQSAAWKAAGARGELPGHREGQGVHGLFTLIQLASFFCPSSQGIQFSVLQFGSGAHGVRRPTGKEGTC